MNRATVIQVQRKLTKKRCKGVCNEEAGRAFPEKCGDLGEIDRSHLDDADDQY